MGIPEHAYRNDGKEPSNEWGTPVKAILEPIYEHFGGIALDPFGSLTSALHARSYIVTADKVAKLCSTLRAPDAPPIWHASANVIHEGSFEDYEWPTAELGLTYGNGPYDVVLSWVRRGYEQAHRKDPSEVLLLVPSRTSAKFMQHFGSRMWTLFWNGRLKFQGAKDTATFHSALLYEGPRPELLRKAFGKKHWLVRPR